MSTNTKILPLEFEYFEPESVAEVLELLSRFKERSRLMAGGTDLLVKIKRGVVNPEAIISLSRVQDLNFIRADQDGLKIGSVTSLSEIEGNSLVRESYSALFEAVRSMAAPAIRNMGTIGGNIGNASPAADTAPALLAYGSTVKVLSTKGERIISLENFFLGPGLSVLEANELIAEVHLPRLGLNEGSAFLKLGRVSADIAKINMAVYLKREGNSCQICRIAFGSVAPTPIRIYPAEKLLKGKPFTDALIKKVALECQRQIKPIDDVRSSKEYRFRVSEILAEEALRAAWLRSGGSL
jgi:carbon-monoxide dehydrogenase medium subunit